jgi:hypothetical protein
MLVALALGVLAAACTPTTRATCAVVPRPPQLAVGHDSALNTQHFDWGGANPCGYDRGSQGQEPSGP